jgi:hypothetical protein
MNHFKVLRISPNTTKIGIFQRKITFYMCNIVITNYLFLNTTLISNLLAFQLQEDAFVII